MLYYALQVQFQLYDAKLNLDLLNFMSFAL
jgi:hypothetical protein